MYTELARLTRVTMNESEKRMSFSPSRSRSLSQDKPRRLCGPELAIFWVSSFRDGWRDTQSVKGTVKLTSSIVSHYDNRDGVVRPSENSLTSRCHSALHRRVRSSAELHYLTHLPRSGASVAIAMFAFDWESGLRVRFHAVTSVARRFAPRNGNTKRDHQTPKRRRRVLIAAVHDDFHSLRGFSRGVTWTSRTTVRHVVATKTSRTIDIYIDMIDWYQSTYN